MDIQKVSLYLAGKLPPYYWDSNIYRFNKVILTNAWHLYTKDDLIFNQTLVNNSKSLKSLDICFFNILDDLFKQDKIIFYKVIQDLEIPFEITDYKWINIEQWAKEYIEQIEINRIGLYLAGKLPPYSPFDKLEFIEELMWVFPENFTEEIFNFIDIHSNTIEQFYSMSLNKAKKTDVNKFIFFLDKIKIPWDARCPYQKNIQNQNSLDLNDNKLVAYLLGLSPINDYKKFPRLLFMESLNEKYNISLEKINFWWDNSNKDEYEFYTLILEYLYSKARKDKYQNIKLKVFFQELDIPEDLYFKISDKDIEDFAKYLDSFDIQLKDFIEDIGQLWIGWYDNYKFNFRSVKILYKVLKEILNTKDWTKNIIRLFTAYKFDKDISLSNL